MCHYRAIINYSAEKKAFLGRIPELAGCEAEGATRVEVLTKLEEEMIAQIENMKAQGVELPQPIEAQSFDGQLSIKVSPVLHGELSFLATMENIELEQLLVELLTRGVSQRWSGRSRQRPEGGRGRRTEGTGQRYHDIMENRADFIEYVRQLETGGGHHQRTGPRGGGRRPKR